MSEDTGRDVTGQVDDEHIGDTIDVDDYEITSDDLNDLDHDDDDFAQPATWDGQEWAVEGVWILDPEEWAGDPFNVQLVTAGAGGSVTVAVDEALLTQMVAIAAAQNAEEPGLFPALEQVRHPPGLLDKLSDRTGWSATNRVWESLPVKVQFGLLAITVVILLTLLTISILNP